MKHPRRIVYSCTAAFFLLLGLAFFLPPGAVWITDNGNKYIQMRNLDAGNGRLIRHPFPELFPAGGFHFFPRPGGAVSFYPEYLSAATVPFYRLSGERGILFWPIAATLVLLALAGVFLHLPPLGLLIATPLLFYSLLMWEMTPSVCLVLMSCLLCLKGGFFAGGAVLGLSLLMREEAYFFAAALGAALLVCGRWRELPRFAGGFLCPALAVWFYQWRIWGHFLGLHGKFYHVNNNADFSLLSQLHVAGFNYFHHLFRFDGWGASRWDLLAWSALLPIIAGAAPTFRSCLKLKYAALGIYFLCTAILGAGLWFQTVPVYAAAGAAGLFAVTPVMAGFTVNWLAFLRNKRYRLWAWTLLFFMAGVPPLLTASDVGLFWGPRHFLILLPLLCFLSFIGFRRMGGLPGLEKLKLRKTLPAAALLLGFFLQCYGIYALARVSEDSFETEQRLLALPEKVVVTDVFYLPEQTPRLFFGKTVVQVTTAEELKMLTAYLTAGKEKTFALVLSPRFRRIPDPVLKDLIARFPLTAPPVRLTGKGGFPDLFAARCAVPLN